MLSPYDQSPIDENKSSAPESTIYVKLEHRDIVLLRVCATIFALLGTAGLVWVLVTFLGRFRDVILLLAFALILAYIISPAVSFIHSRVTFIRRGFVVAAVYICIFILVGTFSFWLISSFYQQVSSLISNLPSLQKTASLKFSSFQPLLNQFGIRININEMNNHLAAYFQSNAQQLATNSASLLSSVATIVTNLVLIFVLSIYMVIDGPRIASGIKAISPHSLRPRVEFFETTVNNVIGGYVRGQATMSLIIGILAGGGSALLGLQYSLIIGILAAFFELVPMLGPVLASIPAIVIALFQPFPLVIWVIIYFVVIQVLESNVLGPRITGHAVGLHPITSIIALVAGAALAGIWGAMFAVPITAFLQVMLRYAYTESRQPAVITPEPGVTEEVPSKHAAKADIS